LTRPEVDKEAIRKKEAEDRKDQNNRRYLKPKGAAGWREEKATSTLGASDQQDPST
jgi:hypothetical protein